MHINLNNLNDKKKEKKNNILTFFLSPDQASFPAWTFFFCIGEEDAEMLKVNHQQQKKNYINTTKKKKKEEETECTVPSAATLQNKLGWSHLQLFTEFLELNEHFFLSGNENFTWKWRRRVAVRVAASGRHSEGETIECVHAHGHQSSSHQSNFLITKGGRKRALAADNWRSEQGMENTKALQATHVLCGLCC